MPMGFETALIQGLKDAPEKAPLTSKCQPQKAEQAADRNSI
jgi:hypothetical protein